MALAAFTQELHPAGGVTGSTLQAIEPVFTLLVALAVLRKDVLPGGGGSGSEHE